MGFCDVTEFVFDNLKKANGTIGNNTGGLDRDYNHSWNCA